MSSNATLVDTQPLEDEFSSMASSPPSSSTWGWFITLKPCPSHLNNPRPVLHPITGEVVRVGRDPSCYLVVDEMMFLGSTDEDLQSAKISRVQFQLSRVGAKSDRQNSCAGECLSCLGQNFLVQTNIFCLFTGTWRTF